ncbi:unnamed protein product [Hermetia illucens]|uniref:UBA domain-containing protein n=2 Tax=Hermetia illucens TaxID=343691 RepID=A0A7R8UMJ0_HERIL|nr:unnamed protein product [Hermetia illucens]
MAASRTDKPSPHSSPRPSRRCTTPNIAAVQNDLYSVNQNTMQSTIPSIAAASSGHSQQIQQAALPNHLVQPIHPTAPPLSPATSNLSSSSAKAGASKASNLNRMSAPMMGAVTSSSSGQVGNKVLNKALSAESNDAINHHCTDLLTGPPIASTVAIAPPLPPRKTSPGVESSVNRSLKPQNNVSAASSLSDLSENSTCQTVNQCRSTENIATTYELDVPRTTAPPIPRHQQARNIDTIANELRNQRIAVIEDDVDKVIVGPAETITGIIDTRPLEARKPIIISVVNSNEKETTSVNNSNNLYHLKTASTPNNNLNHHVRHQSYPNTSTVHQQQQQPAQQTQLHNQQCNTTSSAKSIGTPHPASDNQHPTPALTPRSNTPNPQHHSNQHHHHQPQQVHQSSHHSHHQHRSQQPPSQQQQSQPQQQSRQQPLLYENLTINTKDCNVPYENINLEYIARLMNEGYSKENAITALGISRNNIEMACDILHEFVSKSSV